MRLSLRRWLGLPLVPLMLLAACAQPAPEAADQALACLAPEEALRVEGEHGFSAPVPIRSRPLARPVGGTRVVYLNRSARTYVAGIDDALGGGSSVVSSQGLETATLPGFQQGDPAWRTLRECLRGQFARFDVALTDIRPVTPGYIEAHFGGSGPELAITNGAGGIAPIDNTDCGAVEGAPVFVFSDLFGGNVRSICEVGAHEIAHVFSLDHAYLCKDPMTYIQGCGEKQFQSDASSCGETSERPCICGRKTQNSVVVLRNALGDRRSDANPPKVELLDPLADPSGRWSRVQVRAHDADGALSKIELHVVRTGSSTEEVFICEDGIIPCTIDGELASFAVPAEAVDLRVWAVAEDTSGNRAATAETTLRADPKPAPDIALIVAPVASSYEVDGVVELQALVVAREPVVDVAAIWRDGDGTPRELSMCPREDGRYGVAVHLGRGALPRSFYIRVTDRAGRVAASTEESIVLRARPE